MAEERPPLERRVLYGDRILTPQNPAIATWRPLHYRRGLSLADLRHRTGNFLILLVFGIGVGVLIFYTFPWVPDAIIWLPILAGAALRNTWFSMLYGRANRAVEKLLDDPPTVPQLPVRITLWSGDWAIGKDEGVVSFCDGWMHYQGLRTSFSLHRSNVARHPESGWALGAPFRFAYELQDRHRTLQVQPLNALGSKSRLQWDEFHRLFWYWDKTEEDLNGSPVYPPTMADPAFAGRLKMMVAAWLVLTWELIAVLFDHRIPVFAKIAILPCLMLLAWFAFNKLRGGRDLHAVLQKGITSGESIQAPVVGAVAAEPELVETVQV